jgi:mannan endo-1,4-beta-mannosidase
MSQGQNFIADHQAPGIDFATFHSWPDNWLDDDLTFQTNWIRQHASDAAYLGKPVRCFPYAHSFLSSFIHSIAFPSFY